MWDSRVCTFLYGTNIFDSRIDEVRRYRAYLETCYRLAGDPAFSALHTRISSMIGIGKISPLRTIEWVMYRAAVLGLSARDSAAGMEVHRGARKYLLPGSMPKSQHTIQYATLFFNNWNTGAGYSFDKRGAFRARAPMQEIRRLSSLRANAFFATDSLERTSTNPVTSIRQRA